MKLRRRASSPTCARISAAPAASPFASISRAWNIFRSNLGNIILLALVMAVISFVVGLVASFAAVVILAPTVLPLILELGRGSAITIATTVLATIGLIIGIIIGAIINTLYVTFNSATWTLAYRSFTGATPVATVPPVAPPLPTA